MITKTAGVHEAADTAPGGVKRPEPHGVAGAEPPVQ